MARYICIAHSLVMVLAFLAQSVRGQIQFCNDGSFFSSGNCVQCPIRCRGQLNLCDKTTGECSWGCDDGYWGVMCSQNCETTCKGDTNRCDQYSSRCTDGCEDGWWGTICEDRCSTSCWSETNRCNRDTGRCKDGCDVGYWGDKCENSCSVYCGGDRNLCDRDNGQCNNNCDPGYSGSKCDVTCPSNCASSCDRYTSNCINGCNTGWSGDKCETPCSQGCKDNTCHQVGGLCLNGCKNNYWDESCNIECPSKCAYVEQVCDSVTGACLYGCGETHRSWGIRCEINCPAGCLATCNKTSGVCDYCKTGLLGGSCDQKCNSNCKSNSCQQITGECTSGCVDELWGSFCDKTCSSACINDVCNTYTGKCTSGCDAGYWGDQCGNTCSSGCKDSGLICRRLSGECTYGCKPGYWGVSCDNQCNINCLQTGNICYTTYGRCAGGCRGGYWGNTCDKTCSSVCSACGRNDGDACVGCPVGKWGSSCQNNCLVSCIDNNCIKATGACSRGCMSPVIWGDYCNNTCGENCNNQECDSKSGTCADGCIAGYSGLDCDEACSTGCESDMCDQATRVCTQGCKLGGPTDNWYDGDMCSTEIPSDVHVNNMRIEYENATHAYLTWSSDVKPEVYQYYKYDVGYGSTNDEIDISVVSSYEIQREPNLNKNEIQVVLVRSLNDIKQLLPLSQNKVQVELWQVADISTGSSFTGTIAGAIVGILVLVAAITVLLLFIFLRRCKHRSTDKRQDRDDNAYVDMIVTNGNPVTVEDETETQIVDNSAYSPSPMYAVPDRNKKAKKEETNIKTKTGISQANIVTILQDPDAASDDIISDPSDTCIPVHHLEKYMRDKGDVGLGNQYDLLEKGCVRPAKICMKGINKEKNRYKNIVPYDKSRVVLDVSEEQESDYINASFVKDYYRNKANAYIAGQGPNKNTITDMWRMIWQTGTVQVVMVTQCVEQAKRKCEVYWPDNPHEAKDYVTLTVTLTKTAKYAHYTVETFRLQREEEQREIHRFHYETWPDKTPPKQPFTIVEFRNKIRSYDNKEAGPMLVHCSAGVGRSGTLIALDILLDMMAEEEKIDVFEVVKSMREGRMNMVQMESQYLFLYEALLDQFQCQSHAVSKLEYGNFYQALDIDKGLYYNETMIEQQFKKVCQKSKRYEAIKTHERLTGHSKANAKKNVNSKIVPDDAHRVKLFESEAGSDYINAVYVQTYTKLNGLIVTQIPLGETVTDFWSMIHSYKSPCMILIDDKQASMTFKPENKDQKTYGKLVVSCDDENMQGQLTKTDFTIMKQGTHQALKFRIIELIWPDDKKTPDIKQVNAALFWLTEGAGGAQNTGPPVIMCRDGCRQSGLLAACLHIKQRLQMDNDVDIINSVRSVASNRRQFIPNIEQFRFLYDIALESVTECGIYANI